MPLTHPFSEWLASLKREDKLIEGAPVATRKVPWSMEVALEGDYSGGYTLDGRIREAPDAAATLATMDVTGPVIADGYSTWTCSLAGTGGADTTESLPADADGDGVVYLPFVLVMSPPGGADAYVLAGGTFELRGFV